MIQIVRWLWRGAAATLGAATLALCAARYIRARQPLLDQIRAFNRRHLNPLMLGVAGRRGDYYHALRHVGRQSGHVYVTPLEAFPLPGGFVIPMTYGARTDWARNTLAAGGATLLLEGEALAVTRPRVVRLGEVSHALPVIERLGLCALGIGDLLLLERAEGAVSGRKLSNTNGHV
jgi:deazaflavin-dependent oxidoreductase (nitroreductase family)